MYCYIDASIDGRLPSGVPALQIKFSLSLSLSLVSIKIRILSRATVRRGTCQSIAMRSVRACDAGLV